MRVRAAYTEKRRQMLYTRKRIPDALSLKAITMLDSGNYYGHTGKNMRPVVESKL
ncbi:Uncharacterised protein [Citrobacter freundii]|nr:Uncharacterised protein [Citrobacter freundii]